MGKKSAGLIMYRFRQGQLEVLLVHPGGPFWAKKDEGAWSIPKGEYTEDEDLLVVAKREFQEETGYEAEGNFLFVSTVKQPGGKTVQAWAFEGDCDANTINSNTFSMEWPPRSGKKTEFPEVDRAEWFTLDEAAVKILKGQRPLLEKLRDVLQQD